MSLDRMLFDNSRLARAGFAKKTWFEVFVDPTKRSWSLDEAVRLFLLEVQVLSEEGRVGRDGVFLDVERHLVDVRESLGDGAQITVVDFMERGKRVMGRVVPGLAEFLGNSDFSVWLNVYARIVLRVPPSMLVSLNWLPADEESSEEWEVRVGADRLMVRLGRMAGLVGSVPLRELAIAAVETYEAAAAAADLDDEALEVFVDSAPSLSQSLSRVGPGSTLGGFRRGDPKSVPLPLILRFNSAMGTLASRSRAATAA